MNLTTNLLLALRNNPSAPTSCLHIATPAASGCGCNNQPLHPLPTSQSINAAKQCMLAMAAADKSKLLEALGTDTLVVDYYDTAGNLRKATISRT